MFNSSSLGQTGQKERSKRVRIKDKYKYKKDTSMYDQIQGIRVNIKTDTRAYTR